MFLAPKIKPSKKIFVPSVCFWCQIVLYVVGDLTYVVVLMKDD